jgi:hypothetical protein
MTKGLMGNRLPLFLFPIPRRSPGASRFRGWTAKDLGTSFTNDRGWTRAGDTSSAKS